MELSKEEILHLANLAKLDLTPDEVAKFAKEIPDILTYVGALSEVNTEGVEPMTNAAAAVSPLREDVPVPAPLTERRAATGQFPDTLGALLRVKSVFAHRNSEAKE